MLDIKTGSFPWQLKLVAVLLIALSFSIIPHYPAISAILSFLSLLILTVRSGIEIDLPKKYYREYMAYFRIIRTGKPKTFEEIEYLFINSHKQSEKIYTAHTLQSSTFKNNYYNLFLKFTTGEKIKLLQSSNKKELHHQSHVLAKQLSTTVIDYTSENP